MEQQVPQDAEGEVQAEAPGAGGLVLGMAPMDRGQRQEAGIKAG